MAETYPIDTPSQGLSHGWPAGADHWGGPMNENLLLIDSLIFTWVIASNLSSAPPATDGDKYLVGPNPVGSWANKQGQLAVMYQGGWYFIAPKKGWRVRIESEEDFYWYDGTKWTSENTGDSLEDPDANPDAVKLYLTVCGLGEFDDGELLFYQVMGIPTVFPKLGANSKFKLNNPAPQNVEFKMCRNGSAFGIISVSAGQTTGYFDNMSSVTFSIGDELTIIAPESYIPGLRDFTAWLSFDLR